MSHDSSSSSGLSTELSMEEYLAKKLPNVQKKNNNTSRHILEAIIRALHNLENLFLSGGLYGLSGRVAPAIWCLNYSILAKIVIFSNVIFIIGKLITFLLGTDEWTYFCKTYKTLYSVNKMLQLKSTDHYFKIGEELLANNVSGDILIVTDTATFSAHSLLLVQHVHQLADLLCDHCREAHEEIVVIIPDVEADLVEIALKEFYLKGDSRTLNLIFNAIRIKVKDFDEETPTLRHTDISKIQVKSDDENFIGNDSIVTDPNELPGNDYTTDALVKNEESDYEAENETEGDFQISIDMGEAEQLLGGDDSDSCTPLVV